MTITRLIELIDSRQIKIVDSIFVNNVLHVEFKVTDLGFKNMEEVDAKYFQWKTNQEDESQNKSE